jgi:hypothetical protein
MLALDEALPHLAVAPQAAVVVKPQYSARLTIPEAAT